VQELQAEIQNLTQERDALRSVADDRSHLQSIVADLQAKLADTELKLKEQTSLVCFLHHSEQLLISRKINKPEKCALIST